MARDNFHGHGRSSRQAKRGGGSVMKLDWLPEKHGVLPPWYCQKHSCYETMPALSIVFF